MGLLDIFKREKPEEAVRKWQGVLRSEMRGMDRQVTDIQREQKKTEKAIRDCMKRNDVASAKILARELVRARRTVGRLHQNKAQMNSVSLHLRENLAMHRAAGHLQKSGEVMKLMNNLIKLPEIGKTMQDMAKEMMKAGVMEEMVNDVMEGVMDTEDMEEETELQVDQVLSELAVETTVSLPAAGRTRPAAVEVQQEEAEEEDEMASLQARLDAIRAT